MTRKHPGHRVSLYPALPGEPGHDHGPVSCADCPGTVEDGTARVIGSGFLPWGGRRTLHVPHVAAEAAETE